MSEESQGYDMRYRPIDHGMKMTDTILLGEYGQKGGISSTWQTDDAS
jgi:hypothetical protein